MALITNIPKFKVIEGGGLTPSKWFDLPAIVLGRSPLSRDQIVGYRVAQADARKALDNNRKQPILDLWSSVIGEIPPFSSTSAQLPNGRTADFVPFSSAYACFRGIKRPVANDDTGFDFFAFVHRPQCVFRYEPSMSSLIRPYLVPDDLVFVTHMKLDYPEGRPYGKDAFANAPVRGVITHWGFVEAEPDSGLPVEHRERFRKRMW